MSAASASSVISGEMESGTFERLLTPISHLRIAGEKLLSIVSMWVLMYRLHPLSRSGGQWDRSGLGGSSLRRTLRDHPRDCDFGALGVLSGRMNSRTSIMTALMIVLVLLAPSLFFATSLKKSDFGLSLENVNPVSHAINLLDGVLVDNETAIRQQTAHILPVLAFLALCCLLFVWLDRRFEVRGSE